MPLSDVLLVEKMGVLETSWQRKVQRFLTSLSEGLERTVEPGEEQMSMKAAMDLADRAWRSTSSSVCRRSQCGLGRKSRENELTLMLLVMLRMTGVSFAGMTRSAMTAPPSAANTCRSCFDLVAS